MVAGKPVFVQSPASNTLVNRVFGPGLSASCSGVAAKVARRSRTICQGGSSPGRPVAAATSLQIVRASASRGVSIRRSPALIADLKVPTEFRAIVNAHFRIEPAPYQPAILGLINGTTEWVFAFPGRVAVTISAADRLIEAPRESLARTIWNEIATATGLPAELPPWQIVRERRATFAATPEQDARRPGAITPWRNVFLAGDWTNTGLPATIESAIRSGRRAADLVAQH